MRLIALLSFYDEPVSGLALCVDGLAMAGASHVIAVDGRYSMFPGNGHASPPDQRAHLDAACRHHELGLTTVVPPTTWAGNEPQKRTAMFQIALAMADPGDWFWVVDGDMVTVKASLLPERLAETEHEAAEVLVEDVLARRANRPDWPPTFPMRCLFRAQPIVVGPQHWLYRNPVDGHDVWRGTDREGLLPALDLTEYVTVEHRPHQRSVGRELAKNQYYQRRDELGIEMGACPRCHDPAVKRMVVADRIMKGLPVGHVEEVCQPHAEQMEKLNRRKLIQWGLPPDTKFHERYALPS